MWEVIYTGEGVHWEHGEHWEPFAVTLDERREYRIWWRRMKAPEIVWPPKYTEELVGIGGRTA